MNLKKAVGNNEFEQKAVGNHEFKKAVGNYEFKKKSCKGTMNLKKRFDNFCNSRF